MPEIKIKRAQDQVMSYEYDTFQLRWGESELANAFVLSVECVFYSISAPPSSSLFLFYLPRLSPSSIFISLLRLSSSSPLLLFVTREPSPESIVAFLSKRVKSLTTRSGLVSLSIKRLKLRHTHNLPTSTFNSTTIHPPADS